MIYVYLFIFIFLIIKSIVVRTIVLHPFKTLRNFIIDFYFYFKHLKWHNCPTGKLICYVALFGKGKTLSVVHYVSALYRKHNNKKVWCINRKKFVTQKVIVLSNVSLQIPYIKFTSLKQVVDFSEKIKGIDTDNDTLTCLLVLGDEFSTQMNSRSFKTNIDPMFLNTLLTCRHHHISLIYDAQRFSHVDALLRQVTSSVIDCNKVWRIMVHKKYDAWDLENATVTSLVKPLSRFGWFITNKDYNAYDTLACVDTLTKSALEGGMLTENEILSLNSNNLSVNMDGVTAPSRKFIKLKKKMK